MVRHTLYALILCFPLLASCAGEAPHDDLALGLDSGDILENPDQLQDWATVEDTVDPDVPGDAPQDLVLPRVGDGPFSQGCPQPGRALAREMDVDAGFFGPAAIGQRGDFLLASARAAFVIEAAGRANAYYYYGGILVDAVAVDGCTQTGPEEFEELGLMAGVISLDIYASVLRAFRADSVTVLSDGSDGGPAIVRAVGSDDIFWTTELEMLVERYRAGKPVSLSHPLGLEMVVDYILEPDSAVLRIETTMRNLGPEKLHLLAGAEAQFGQTMQPRYLALDTMSLGGFQLQRGLPWMVAANGHGATAYAVADGELATLGIAGVTALFDALQLETDSSLAPAGEVGDSRSTTSFVAVGDRDANSATTPLHAVNPEPVPGWSYELAPISGAVMEEVTGKPLAGVVVTLAGETSNGLAPLDSFITDGNGEFSGWMADFGPELPLSLVVAAPGYPTTGPQPVDPGSLAPQMLTVPATGQLAYLVLDEAGIPIPAKLELRQNGSLKRRLWAGTELRFSDVVPGDYQLEVSRGYEYEVYQAPLKVLTGEPTSLEVTLLRVVDTTGYLALDTHLHAAPSSDSDIAVPHRLVTVAGEGVEIAVATDHETISDWSWAIPEAGLAGFINTIIGQEVTCTLPEHINMFPVGQRFDIDSRGGIPRWYGKDIEQVFAMLWDRGAQVVCLNHPRGGGGYMTLIEYDSISGEPTLADPTLLAWPDDASLWSWNFNAIELMNGPKMIFRTPDSPHKTGHFDDWLGFHNLGHRVTALGSSDTHGESTPGRSRTYVQSSTDDPAAMDQDELAANIDAGRAVVSAGAFLRVWVDNEAGPGETITPQDDVIDVAIHVEASPAVDVAFVKVYANCDQVATLTATDPGGIVKLDTKIPVKLIGDSHIVVAAFGTEPIPAALGTYAPTGVPRAIANPVFVDVDGNGLFDPPGPKSCSYDLEGPVS